MCSLSIVLWAALSFHPLCWVYQAEAMTSPDQFKLLLLNQTSTNDSKGGEDQDTALGRGVESQICSPTPVIAHAQIQSPLLNFESLLTRLFTQEYCPEVSRGVVLAVQFRPAA